MAPQVGTSARQRYNLLAAQNVISGNAIPGFSMPSGKQAARAPLITYSRKDRPLSLTADQFVRRGIYDLSSDDGAEDAGDHEQACSDEAGSRTSSMSGLSDATAVESAPVNTAQHVESVKSSKLRPSGTTATGSFRRNPSSATTTTRAGSQRGKPIALKLRRGILKAVRSKNADNAPNGPPRRLPVGELVCVPSLSDDVEFCSSGEIRCSGGQDSLRQSTNAVLAKRLPPQKTTSATAIRKRLVTAKLRIKKLRRIDTLFGHSKCSARAGDGFEASEMQITNRLKPTRRHRRPRTALMFKALNLGNGSLPEVTFDTPADQLQLETIVGGSHLPTATGNNERSTALPSTTKRRVSFSNQLELIRAQLSSVRAMRRPSDSDSEDEERGVEDEDEEAVVEGFEAVGYGEGEEQFDNEATEAVYNQARVPTPKQLRPRSSTSVPIDEIEEDNDMIDGGITLKFTPSARPTTHPQLSATSLNQVNEKIEDIPAPTKTPLRRRSNLKNSTPGAPNTSYSPEHTEANTRRNSMVVLEESRYFADAIQGLAAPDPSKHHIVPRRRSRYEEMREWDHADECEAALQPLNYVGGGSVMPVLRATSENTYTTRSLPGPPPRDLKSLTRSVSKEHGTLSLSTRRRSSLTFQSPMLIR